MSGSQMFRLYKSPKVVPKLKEDGSNRQQIEVIKNYNALPPLDWKKVPATTKPMTPATLGKMKGYQLYIPGLLVADKRGQIPFSASFGTNDDQEEKGDAATSGSLLEDSTSILDAQAIAAGKRASYQKRVVRDPEGNEVEETFNNFVEWWADNFEVLTQNNPKYRKPGAFDTREKIIADARKRLSTPVKDLSDVEDHPELANYVGIRYKISTRAGRNQTRILTADADGKLDALENPKTGQMEPINGCVADVKQYCDTAEIWHMHIIDTKKDIFLILLTDIVTVYRERPKILPDPMKFGFGVLPTSATPKPSLPAAASASGDVAAAASDATAAASASPQKRPREEGNAADTTDTTAAAAVEADADEEEVRPWKRSRKKKKSRAGASDAAQILGDDTLRAMRDFVA